MTGRIAWLNRSNGGVPKLHVDESLVTTDGMQGDHQEDQRDVAPGRRQRLGGIEVEVTSFASPCQTIRASFLDEDFTRISHKLYPGWSRVYARVLHAGVLRRDDDVVILPEPTLS